MVKVLLGLIRSIRRNRERRALAREFRSLNDHLLEDIGLRRNQVGDGGAGLFREAKPLGKRRQPAPIACLRPSLQGCG